jgi:hypothetical protein
MNYIWGLLLNKLQDLEFSWQDRVIHQDWEREGIIDKRIKEDEFVWGYCKFKNLSENNKSLVATLELYYYFIILNAFLFWNFKL